MDECIWMCAHRGSLLPPCDPYARSRPFPLPISADCRWNPDRVWILGINKWIQLWGGDSGRQSPPAEPPSLAAPREDASNARARCLQAGLHIERGGMFGCHRSTLRLSLGDQAAQATASKYRNVACELPVAHDYDEQASRGAPALANNTIRARHCVTSQPERLPKPRMSREGLGAQACGRG